MYLKAGYDAPDGIGWGSTHPSDGRTGHDGVTVAAGSAVEDALKRENKCDVLLREAIKGDNRAGGGTITSDRSRAQPVIFRKEVTKVTRTTCVPPPQVRCHRRVPPAQQSAHESSLQRRLTCSYDSDILDRRVRIQEKFF